MFLAIASLALALARPPVSVIHVPNNGIQPQIVQVDHVVHLLYYSGDPAHGDLYYTNSKDEGGSWSSAVKVNTETGDAIAIGNIRGGQLAVGKNGRVHVVWLGSKTNSTGTDMGMPLLYTRLKDDGTGFEPERNLQGKTFSLDGGASVAADDGGDVYVAWHAAPAANGDESQRKVFLAESTDEGKDFAAESPVWDRETGACSCCSLKALSSGDRVWIFYRGAEKDVQRDPYLLSSVDKGRSFIGHKMSDWEANTCPMSSFSLDTHNGKVYSAWERRGVIQWQASSGQPSRGVGNHAKYPVILVNGDGETLLAWTEEMDWGTGGSVVWQVYDRNGKPVPSQSGRQDGVPAWSLVSAFVRKDGSFAVVY
jgi:hypothetical protein